MKVKIEPQFNNIYVSWSKNKENSYIESKLYGYVTRLYCTIPNNEIGLDIEGFDVFYRTRFDDNITIARGEEREVVFPTIEEYVKKIEYLR